MKSGTIIFGTTFTFFKNRPPADVRLQNVVRAVKLSFEQGGLLVILETTLINKIADESLPFLVRATSTR